MCYIEYICNSLKQTKDMAKDAKTVLITINTELHEKLKEAALKDSRPLSNFIKVQLEKLFLINNLPKVAPKVIDEWEGNDINL